MANYLGIGATSAALTGLIRDHYPRDQFGTTLDVALYQAHDFETPMREGFSVFLYRVTVNGTVRNMNVRRTPDGRRFRASLPLDLHYLVTPWAQDVEQQHRMLGWVMRFIEDQGSLSAGHLNHYVAENDIFGPNEGLEIICDPLGITDQLNLWDRLRSRFPISVSYTMRMLPIDSELEIGRGAAPVQTRALHIGEPA